MHRVKFINKLYSPIYTSFKLTLTSLLLLTGINGIEAKQSIAKELKSSTNAAFAVATSAAENNIFKGKMPKKNGIYLYGQSQQPNQIGQEYMVFEVRQGKVTGAFYLPQSEFNCFQGSLVAGKLDLTIAGDAGSTPYSDSIADAQNAPQVATASDSSQIGAQYEQVSSQYSVALQNYYQLSNVNENDKQILAACKSNYQE
ncbi:MAG TPA: hypothetical protein V6D09_11970 [Leptolyngbyaceae cyanobacterium]